MLMCWRTLASRQTDTHRHTHTHTHSLTHTRPHTLDPLENVVSSMSLPLVVSSLCLAPLHFSFSGSTRVFPPLPAIPHFGEAALP